MPNRRQPGRTIDVALALASFRRNVLKSRPHFVLSFMNKYNAFALASLWGTGIPVIVSERDSPTEVLPRFRVLARDLLYPWAAGAIFQTAAAQAFHLGRSRIVRSAIIPNPITRIIEPSERKPEKIVLSVGRLVEKKAVDHLISAFGAMKVPGWRLMICGDGPMRAALEAQVRSLELSNRVDFIGAVSDLRPYFKRAGMLAFSSLYEGFPNALAEAMISGLPCVSYDCPTGPSELIQDRVNGRLVPVGDWTALAAAMDEVAADQVTADRYGTASATLARALDAGTIADRFLDFCDEAARNARR
jgi:GalNAc-alpha-(1->4)-GalNAc-alpha-(1->3)-diNAcBac-PP-undecaprenol alpha-1,4-N-acetyl-D-galactosaminyltransferase